MSRLTQLLPRRGFAIVMLIVSCTLVKATAVTNRKDDVEIAVTTKIDDNGRTLIDCVLYNQSPHTIATINLQTPSSVFYFQLLDQAGKEIQQDPKWAMSFAQKSSWRYSRPRSARLDVVNPGENLKFQFYLDDAYGAESSKGHKMAISWESKYIDDIIVTSDYTNAKGEQIKGSDEKYMFPPKWDISVSLPLKESAIKEHEKIGVSSPDPKSSGNKIAHLPDSSSPRVEIDSAKKSIPDKKNYFWWLLLIPLLLLVRYAAALKR